MTAPWGEVIVTWWERHGSPDVDEAQMWLEEHVEKLSREFEATFPEVVERVQVES